MVLRVISYTCTYKYILAYFVRNWSMGMWDMPTQEQFSRIFVHKASYFFSFDLLFVDFGFEKVLNYLFSIMVITSFLSFCQSCRCQKHLIWIHRIYWYSVLLYKLHTECNSDRHSMLGLLWLYYRYLYYELWLCTRLVHVFYKICHFDLKLKYSFLTYIF